MTPFIPPKNGLPVTTRQISWSAIVIPIWGEQWSRPDKVYYLADGEIKDDTTLQGGAFYQRT